MVSYRISRHLVRLAARRWPDPDTMAGEWEAELHELRSEGRAWPQLRFAASLLRARPRNEAAAAWRRSPSPLIVSALTVAIGPTLCLLMAFLALVPLFALPVVLAVVIAAFATGQRSILGGAGAALLAGTSTALTMTFVAPALDADQQHAPAATALWLALLLPVTFALRALPVRLAITAGPAAAVGAAWAAVTWMVWQRNRAGWQLPGDPAVYHLPAEHALWWHPVGLLNLLDADVGPQFDGLPSGWLIADYVEMVPHHFTLLGIFVVTYAVSARLAADSRARPAAGPSEPVST
jgi:hypothetical protein